MKRECRNCNNVFNHGVSGNMIIFCPNCKKSTGYISDYGFGPIVPCVIYLGEKIIGEIINLNCEYRLKSDFFEMDEKLLGEYSNLEVYREAEKVVEERLKKC